MLPLSCTCSLARENVSYPNFGGAKAPVVTQRRPIVATKVLAAGHLNRLYCVWRISFQHHTMRALAAHMSMSSRSHYPHRILAAPVMLGSPDTVRRVAPVL